MLAELSITSTVRRAGRSEGSASAKTNNSRTNSANPNETGPRHKSHGTAAGGPNTCCQRKPVPIGRTAGRTCRR